ncbi:MAG: hypothetical protein JWN75_395 [Candidatus Saccharibacteria bacterium]|nr:hypothetical protein [Candidatus Saccharibacteria bacterium]
MVVCHQYTRYNGVMVNLVEPLRDDNSEFVDPVQAADELIAAAEMVKRRLKWASLPLTRDAKEILRLSEIDKNLVINSVDRIRRRMLTNAIVELSNVINDENDGFQS